MVLIQRRSGSAGISSNELTARFSVIILAYGTVRLAGDFAG